MPLCQRWLPLEQRFCMKEATWRGNMVQAMWFACEDHRIAEDIRLNEAEEEEPPQEEKCEK